MRTSSLITAALVFIILAGYSAAAEVPIPAFPVVLNDHNTKVTFAVDSTWHMVHGTTSEVSGVAELPDSGDETGVRAELSLPVSGFDTGNGMRDRKMREVLHAERFPKIGFRLLRVETECDRRKSAPGDSCPAVLHGELTIRGVTRRITAPAVLSSSLVSMKVEGETSILWPDFGVEDPSILVARVDEQVKIKFVVELPFKRQ